LNLLSRSLAGRVVTPQGFSPSSTGPLFSGAMLRMHYLDEGPADAEDVVLLMHGEPSWCYLYRKMVGPLTVSLAAGWTLDSGAHARVCAMLSCASRREVRVCGVCAGLWCVGGVCGAPATQHASCQAAGYRVIAPDLVGFGRSDKPSRMSDYTYERHVEWTRQLLFDVLGLEHLTLVRGDVLVGMV
jgi:haloalkane dehalogenase